MKLLFEGDENLSLMLHQQCQRDDTLAQLIKFKTIVVNTEGERVQAESYMLLQRMTLTVAFIFLCQRPPVLFIMPQYIFFSISISIFFRDSIRRPLERQARAQKPMICRTPALNFFTCCHLDLSI